ncbi:cobyric acid synthase [Rathayibacter sp. VKM Ac-2803]|uniref:cobyric acid synthase n=1 Tax=unclassified Rathayibacter TaxID=2609250 RepID=UPI00135BD2DD|nr:MULTISPECIES: cobyric acid synthase [unclassified Rathayibacter]MWV49960.1 cobyric acid synthase [Rathayibacter sp. VKM Ac-2803]MWV58092.1 cobyric acid synthase [Rathayibacter sp. VKM Ac-2754]
MTALRIGVLAPEVLDSNGDAANARVLVARARWAGLDAELVPLRSVDDVTTRTDVVVAGTGADQDLPVVLELLRDIGSVLKGWVADGTEIVAVGAGWQLLTESFTTPEGVVGGVGVFPGRSVAGERATDDLVVSSGADVLVGFENHVRRVDGIDPAHVLGAVLHGVGDGRGVEGYLSGGLLGTHLHGPVLAKNPVLADAILTRVAARHSLEYSTTDDRLRAADETARAAREVIAKRLGVSR